MKVQSAREIICFRYRADCTRTVFTFLKSQQDSLAVDLPPVFNRFKIVILRGGEVIHNTDAEGSVLCHPVMLPSLTKVLGRYNFKPTRNDSLVVAGGDDKLSSSINHLKPYEELFRQIYHENKDIECKWVSTIPVWVMYRFVAHIGIENFINAFNSSPIKTHLIGTAFGAVFNYRKKDYNEVYECREKLREFINRDRLVKDFYSSDGDEYIKSMQTYKFFAAASSNGLQPVKIYEALSCETIPVVIDNITVRELRDNYNLPIVIIDSWEHLTEQFLNEAWDSIYKHVDWENVKQCALVSNFAKLYLQDTIDRGSNSFFTSDKLVYPAK